MPRPIRLVPADAPSRPWFGSRLRVLVDPEDLGGRLALHVVDVPAGRSTPPHVHGQEAELFLVLQGSMVLRTPDGATTLEGGDLALIPRGVAHVADHAAADARVIVGLAPAGLQAAFRRVAEAADQSPALLASEMRTFGVRLLERLEPAPHPLVPGPPAPVRVVRAREAERVHLVGDEYAILLSGDDTGGFFDLCHFRVPPGGGPPVHVHREDEEVFHVLRGRVSLHADGERASAGPGDTVILPRNVPHGFRNETDADVEMLCVTSPSGFADMIRAAGRPATGPAGGPVAPPTDDDRARLVAAATRHGVELRPHVAF